MKLNIDQTLQQGIVAHKGGRLQEAERLYYSILKSQPTHLEATYNLGVIAASMNKAESAISFFQIAVKLNPHFVEAYYSLGNLLKELGRLEEAEASYKKATKFKPDFVEAYYNLGSLLKELGRLEEAEASYKKATKFKPDFVEAHSNRGNILKDLGRLEEAEASYKEATKFKPDFVEAHSNRGNILKDLGRYDEAIGCYEKAISLNSNLIEPRYNLGLILFNRKNYKEAIAQFKLINFQQSKNFLLKIFYLTGQQSNFYKQLDSMISQGETNAVIGSLISRSEIKYKINRLNPFCNDPLKYVLKVDLNEKYDFKKIFIKTAKNILKDDSVSSKRQGYLTNGRQTAGNLFALEGDHIDQIENIIHLELEKYRIHFKNSEEGFIKNWPTTYKIKGWLVNMKSGGNLNAHMHDMGWITGSIYINVPLKSKTNSGNLVVCLDDEKYETKERINKKSIIDVKTGNLCLFPASLLHYTIPFEAEEDRTVLAFDVIPN